MSKSPKGPFVVIVTDKEANTFSVEGPVSDDTKWGNAVCDAQKQGRRVTCDVPNGITSVEVAAAQYGRTYPDMTRVERGSIVSYGIP